MERLLFVVNKLFNALFVTRGNALYLVIRHILISTKPLLLIPVVLLIIGFTVSLIKRIIHS